jgi:hypothetical protein
MFSDCYFLHILDFAPHALHILILGHLYAYTLDCDEPALEEKAQAADTNPVPEQGKPRYI